MEKDRKIFLEISSELTGYSILDLEGTGLVNQYKQLVEQEIGPKITGLFYFTAKTVTKLKTQKDRDKAMKINILASPTLWPICKNLIVLWYRGQWTSMTPYWFKYYAGEKPPAKVNPEGPPIVPSAQAYTQQLSYRAAGAHPPGANPTGYASWAMDPVFGDFTTHKNQ